MRALRRSVFPVLLSFLFFTCVASRASADVELNGLSARWCWQAAGGPVAGYEVQLARAGAAFAPAGDAPGGASGLCVIATGADGESILVRVRAFSASKATFGPWSPESDLARFHVALTAPGKPAVVP